MNEKGDTTYSFELKDLSYKELFEVYKSMGEFISFLTKSRDNAEVVADEEEEGKEDSEEKKDEES